MKEEIEKHDEDTPDTLVKAERPSLDTDIDRINLLQPPTTAKKRPIRSSTRGIFKKKALPKRPLFNNSMRKVKREVNIFATPKGSTCLTVKFPPLVNARKSVLKQRVDELFVDFESEF